MKMLGCHQQKSVNKTGVKENATVSKAHIRKTFNELNDQPKNEKE